MRSQTRWFFRVVGVFTLTTILFSISTTKTFAQASLIDPTFKASPGAGGEFNASSGVYSLLIQDDGKIIVGGEFTRIAGQARTNLARLHSDGQLDTSFPQGTDGAVYRLLKQPDGKILIAGAFTNLQGVVRRGIGRLLTNGMVDLSFDAGPVIGSYDSGFSLGLQSDGKILVGTPVQRALFRLNPNGQPDSGFVQTNLFDRWHISAICPRTNGSILLAGGFQGVNGVSSPGLALLHTNGEVNLGFSSPLNTNTSDLDISGVYTLAEQPDHGFLIGGRFWKQGSTNRQALAKLTTTLDWDVSFQPDSFDPNLENPGFGVVQTVLRHSDGKYVLGGCFQEVGGFARHHVVRMDLQGRVDSCFDSGFGLASHFLGVVTLVEQADGKILAGGFFSCFSGAPVATASSSNLTRLLLQTDCGVTRMHLGQQSSGQRFVVATCAPGGTNHLQASTNLVDWVDVQLPSTYPYFYHEVGDLSILPSSGAFFRLKKEY